MRFFYKDPLFFVTFYTLSFIAEAMKRTCLHKNTNNHEQNTCNPDCYRDHRVKKERMF
jgi:hypothetical protein